MPSICLKRPSGLSVLFRLEKACIRIGRDPENDLVVRDPSVSRFHAEIRREGVRWFLVDLGSSNGTCVGDVRIEENRRLKTGDEIRIGDTRLVFNPPEGSSSCTDSDTGAVRTARIKESGNGVVPNLIGESVKILALKEKLEKIAPTDATVLIRGENGTGKELVARLLHHRSHQAEGPFVAVNCPALPKALLEAELFGIEAGVATDVKPRGGRFEEAAGGTLFLDEIGDMDPGAQAKVLRALEERVIERVGGRKPISLEARIVSATNHDLEEDMARGRFRRDLYHRLNMVVLHLPPLRERREDIPLLAKHFLEAGNGGPPARLNRDALCFLMEYHYPGNVRELKNLLEGARLLARDPVIGLADLHEAAQPTGNGDGAESPQDLLARVMDGGGSFWEEVREPFLRRELSREEVREFVRLAHERAGGSYKEAARLMGIEHQYKKFVNFLRQHSLRISD